MLNNENNHLTLGIYASKSYKYNVVKDEHLADHIKYNREWRPGRLLYVDGKRVYNGVIKDEYLAEYDKVAEEFFATAQSINMDVPTIPYR